MRILRARMGHPATPRAFPRAPDPSAGLIDELPGAVMVSGRARIALPPGVRPPTIFHPPAALLPRNIVRGVQVLQHQPATRLAIPEEDPLQPPTELRARVRAGTAGQTPGLGAAFCTELDDALATLKATLAAAEAVGLDKGTPPPASYALAKAYYDKQTGFFTKDYIAWGTACSDDVNEAIGLIKNLNSDITAAGGKPVETDTIQKPKNPLLFGLPSWILPVGIGVAVLAVAAPVLGPLLAGRMAKRKAALAGANEQRRRKRRRKR